MINKRSFVILKGFGVLAVSLLFILIGCNRTEIKAIDRRKLEATTQSIQRNFVNVSCVRCHAQAATVNRNVALGDISKIIEADGHVHEHGSMRLLIKPGCPKQSFFLSIMKEGKMPPSPEAKVSTETLKVIEDWIVSLKPNAGNACNDDEPGGSRESGEPGEPN